jgi:hypothetical protein
MLIQWTWLEELELGSGAMRRGVQGSALKMRRHQEREDLEPRATDFWMRPCTARGTEVSEASWRRISSTDLNSRWDGPCGRCEGTCGCFLSRFGWDGSFMAGSGGFLEELGECFAGAVQLAPHGVGGLISQRGNLVVAEFLVGDEEEQQAVFLGERVEGVLDALAEFLGLEHAQRGFRRGGTRFHDGVVRVAKDVAVVPALAKVLAMVDGDAIKPGAPGGGAAELVEFAEGLEKNVVGNVLGFGGITKKAQCQVIDGAAVSFVEGGEVGSGDLGRAGECWLGFQRHVKD